MVSQLTMKHIVRTSQSAADAAIAVNMTTFTHLQDIVTDCQHYSVNEDVIIRLKWGQTEYMGTLISVDSYMNIQLSNTEEFIDGKSTGALGQVLIR